MRSSSPDNGDERRTERLRALPNGSARFARRVLLVSFLLSLLVHAIVALGVRYDALRPKSNDVEQVTLEHRPRVLTVVPKLPSHPPTPVPTPQQTPPPTQAPSAKPRTAPSLAPNGSRSAQAGPATTPQAANATALPVATSSPTPVATVAAACTRSDAPPALLATPPPPDFSPEVRHAAPNGTYKVAVTIDERGVVTDAAMRVSTGNPAADVALVTMARGAHYAPATKSCKPVAGEYVMVVRLAPW